ncbi:MAG: DUF4340 domain-containing protein [Bacteroidetes bacterium]|nr:MAG: DUF4340 domain-containing protein [Bacteroidota bacterium]
MGIPLKLIRQDLLIRDMKNKHLVLLFLGVVLLGLLVRWLPFHYRTELTTALIPVDMTRVDKCIVQVLDNPELVLIRSDTRWVAMQDGRTTQVQAPEVQNMLKMLADIRKVEVMHSVERDTLGLLPDERVAVRLFQGDDLLEEVWIGRELQAEGHFHTFIELPSHSGIYQVSIPVRREFQRKLEDFRDKTAFSFDADNVQKIGVRWTGSLPEYLVLNDSSERWVFRSRPGSVSSDSVAVWLKALNKLNTGIFADNFDESQESGNLYVTFYLANRQTAFLTLRIYYCKPTKIPEDISRVKTEKGPDLPAYVLYSSQNQQNYFALKDTNLIRYLCNSLVQRPAQPTN